MSAERRMTREEWVQAALDACVAQGFSVAIEDPATLEFLADVFAYVAPITRQNRPRKAGPVTTNADRPLAKENARARHDTSSVRQGGGRRHS
jgi:hypothetical protein